MFESFAIIILFMRDFNILLLNVQTYLTFSIIRSTVFKTSTACYIFPTDTRNPCLDRKCSFGAVCVSSLDGLSARCQCPDRCYNLGDNEGGHPICGTDGVDYENACELRRTSCRDMKDIVKKYNGKCDPCKEAICHLNHICKLDGRRNAACQCFNVCTEMYSPVCANDGKTYKNKCLMELEGCKRGRLLGIVHSGNCSQVNPCLKIKCDFYAECQIISFTKYQCVCPELCDKTIRPVCGSDGRSYDNVCELMKNSCMLQRWIRLSRSGLCDNQLLDASNTASPVNLCNDKECHFKGKCVMLDDHAMCQCQNCSNVASDPVCGSDGKTYNNKCEVTRKSCLINYTITIQHFGSCGSCPCNVIGSLNAQCGFENLLCRCKHGVGGSRCDRCETTFWGFSNIIKDHHDGCIECNCSDFGSVRKDCEQSTGKCDCKPGFTGIQCQFCPGGNLIRNNTCADDNNENMNIICKACEFGGECKEYEGKQSCTCPSCINYDAVDEVCGSDGVTYISMCHLEQAVCRLQTEIILLHNGKCNDNSLKIPNSLKLDGGSFYEFKKKIKDRRRTHIKMSLKTNVSDALVFLELGSFDFISIGLNGGKLKIIFNLGKDVSHALPTLYSENKIDDNTWHLFVMERKGRMMKVRVDNETPHIVHSTAGAVNFNSKGFFYLGGSNKFIEGFPVGFMNKFKGCIKDVSIDNNDFIFNNATLKLPIC